MNGTMQPAEAQKSDSSLSQRKDDCSLRCY